MVEWYVEMVQMTILIRKLLLDILHELLIEL